jgi:signal transduction histidine kinase
MKLQFRLTLSYLLIVATVTGASGWVLHERLQEQFQKQFEIQVKQAKQTVSGEIQRVAQDLKARLKRALKSPGIASVVTDLKYARSTVQDQKRWLTVAQTTANAFNVDALWLIDLGNGMKAIASSHAPPGTKIPQSIRAFASKRAPDSLIVHELSSMRGSNTPTNLIEAAVIHGPLLLVGGEKVGFGIAEGLRAAGTEVTIRDRMNQVIASTLDADEIVENPPGFLTQEVLLNNPGQTQPALKVQVHVSRAVLSAQQNQLLTTIGWVTGIAGFMAFLLGAVIARRISAPVRMLAHAARQIAAGTRELELPSGRSDEIGELVTAFTDMTHQLSESEERLRRAERVAAWQEIARELAHEIKNPLTSIQMSIENVRRVRGRQPERFEEVFDESTKTIMDEVERLKGLVTEFSNFARLPKPNPVPAKLNEVVHSVVALYRDNPEGVALIENLDDSLVEQALDPERMTQVVQNLIKNAIQSTAVTDRPGRVQITTKRDDDGTVELVVEDNGCGIPKDDMDRVFVPYFTSKSGGTGLGLAVVHRIVSGHNGRIIVTSKQGHGTRFTVRFPTEAA